MKHSRTLHPIALAAALCAALMGATITLTPAAARLEPQAESSRIDSIRALIEHNGWSFDVAPNSLTNIPWEQFEERYLGLRLPEGAEVHCIVDDHGIGDRDLPARWDWREHGAVPGVRHQGACGSCWDFSAAGALESAIMIAEGFEVDISEQHALSCNTGGSSCNGGWMEDAYEVWQTYGAIAEENMPYEADDDIPCPGDTYPPVAKAGTVHDVGYSVSQIKNAIYYHGPVSATMMVYPDLVPYAGGCYDHPCPGELNHAIVLVGWDDTYCNGNGAWIMKNSWGTDWGVAGYAYIQYDAACIGNYATYVDYIHVADLLGIVHTPLEDTENTTDPYVIEMQIISTGGQVDLDASYVAYRIDNGPWEYLEITPTGGDTYTASIPAQGAGTKVEYYIHAEDTAGKAKTVPMWAPDEAFVFLVGSFETILFEDFETESGWTVGAPGDDATTGIWERADPEGTTQDGWYVQSEDDHTPAPGRYCFVTDGRAGSDAGTYDVDGGRTTLLSPVYDLSDYRMVVIDYWRWYTNRRGSNPYQDIWEVSVRSGDSEWVPIEYTSSCRENWSHQVHVLNDFIELGPEVQFRFVASDEDGGSLVEALVDDIELRGVPGGASDAQEAAASATGGPALRVLSPVLRTSAAAARIELSLPRGAEARIRLLDCSGRLLSERQPADLPAGRSTLDVPLRTRSGLPLEAGVYFVVVETCGERLSKAVVVAG